MTTNANPTTVPAVVVRDFNDAGEEQNFTAGETVELEPGRFQNFKAGGLVRAADGDQSAA